MQIILHAYVEETKEKAIVEVVYASENSSIITAKLVELEQKYPNDYLAIYDVPTDIDLTQLPHYPSVAIGKEEFEL